jgi:hypothetical protein
MSSERTYSRPRATVIDDGSVALALHGAVAWGAEALNRMNRESPCFTRLLELQEQLEALRNDWLADA